MFEYSLCLYFINSEAFLSFMKVVGNEKLIENFFEVNLEARKFLEEFVNKEYQYAKRQVTWFKKYKELNL